jgi:hypothetical protein
MKYTVLNCNYIDHHELAHKKEIYNSRLKIARCNIYSYSVELRRSEKQAVALPYIH